MHSAMNFVEGVCFLSSKLIRHMVLNYPLLQTAGEVLVCASRHQKVARHCQLVQGRAAGHRLTICFSACWLCAGHAKLWEGKTDAH